MRESVRTSTGTYDGGGGGTNSIVEQTTDIINRFRNSIVRSRKERLLDEDFQATENIVDQLHSSELISKETLTKLVSQGDSMQRSFRLINQLENEIKDIAEDLDEVNGSKCCGLCSKGSCFGCFHGRKKKKHRRTKKDFSEKLKSMDLFKQTPENLSIEREEMLNKTRSLARERREHPNFQQILTQLQTTKIFENETNEKTLSKVRDYLLQNHSLSYGYIDEPDHLMNEINMAIHFTQLNTHLDHLLQITGIISGQVNQQNILISKIESQAMESGNLLTDYTLLGHHILGTSNTQLPILDEKNPIGMSTGQKVLLNTIL